MRELTDHKVAGVTDGLSIFVADEPGAGGACHRYNVMLVGNGPPAPLGAVHFQNGPIKENGINGLTQEVLLTIVIDRLRSFQAGAFACAENHVALLLCEQALAMLKQRTEARQKRGVEGTNVK